MIRKVGFSLVIMVAIAASATITVNATEGSSAGSIADVVYVPSLSYRIASRVEIGIEKQGRYERLITNTHESAASTSSSSSRSSSTLNETDTTKVRKKTTNPAKRKSRPKASGLLGGVARAFGGDYSGLLQWGGGFLDHMAEPRYNWDVTETYSTKENAKTETSQSIENTWSDTSKLRSVITEELKYDINKGFIGFSVSLTNIGERTIHINRPNFIIHFLQEDGGEVFAASAKVVSGLESGGTISPNQRYLLEVRAEDLDFLSLSDKFRRANGISISLQDLKVRRGGEQLAVSEVKERLQGSHVQFDYFDGNRRSTRYLRVQPGSNLEEFLHQALANKNYSLGENGSSILLQEVSGLKSSPETFASLTEQHSRYHWRRWFVSVLDDNGRVFEASRESKLYPGYSVKVGYFGAKDILPESDYKPVVYRKTDVKLDTGTLYQLPLTLQEGDIIEFTDLRFGGFYLNRVDFNLAPATPQEVKAATPSAAGPGGFYGGPIFNAGPESWIQRIKKGKDHQGPQYTVDKYLYKLTPQSVARVSISNPEVLIQNGSDDFPITAEESLLLLRGIQSQRLKERFVHYRNVQAAAELEFGHPTITINNPLGQQMTMADMFELIGMLRRPGETNEAFLLRWLEEEQIFRYQVTETVPQEDNYWRFAAPTIRIPAGHIQLEKQISNPASIQKGYLFSDGAVLAPIEIVRPGYGFGGFHAFSPWTMPMGNRDPRKYLYLPDLDSPFKTLNSMGQGMDLPIGVGTELTGTLQVVRY